VVTGRRARACQWWLSEAETHADQDEQDHAVFQATVKDGKAEAAAQI
jgi:hypothetical protein